MDDKAETTLADVAHAILYRLLSSNPRLNEIAHVMVIMSPKQDSSAAVYSFAGLRSVAETMIQAVAASLVEIKAEAEEEKEGDSCNEEENRKR